MRPKWRTRRIMSIISAASSVSKSGGSRRPFANRPIRRSIPIGKNSIFALFAKPHMSSTVSLPGSDALSSFRLDKIRQEAARLGVALGELSARYWHFLELEAALDAAARQQMAKPLV